MSTETMIEQDFGSSIGAQEIEQDFGIYTDRRPKDKRPRQHK